MKYRVISISVLVLAAALMAHGAMTSPQKAIADPAEYRAYSGALEVQDAAQKAAALEAFVAKYPESVVKIDALEQAMAAYQDAGNQPKMEEVASSILKLSPENLQAMTTLAFLKRNQANAQAAAEARALGVKGLEVLSRLSKPDDVKDEDFQNLQKQMTAILAGACGFGALQVKEYAAARDCYLKSLQANPENMIDSFQLGVAQLEMEPLDSHGFWHVARAINLAKGNAAALDQFNGYGKGNYIKYHGSEAGWDQIVSQAAAQAAPPADFSVSKAAALKEAPVSKRPVRK